MIRIKYSSVDGFRKLKSFKTLAGARKYAQERIGKNPDIGRNYAVSFDGIGKIEVYSGCVLTDLFGDAKKPGLPEGEFPIFIVHPIGKWFLTRAEAEAEVTACIKHDPEGCYGPYDIQEDTMRKEDVSPPKPSSIEDDNIDY